MCTVTVLRGPWATAGDGETPSWRLVCSRDEQRTRPLAAAPAVGRIGLHEVVSPIDPQGPGTWIAATSAGLVFALLNRYPSRPSPSEAAAGERVSRGRIIPMLAGALNLDDLRRRASRLGPLRTAPFTLLIAGDDGVLEYTFDGDRLAEGRLMKAARLLRTASSVDGDAVTEWRGRMFETLVPEGDAAAQRAFHRTADTVAPHRGVLMDRADACTVSITRIDMYDTHLRMAHQPLTPGQPASALEVRRRS